MQCDCPALNPAKQWAMPRRSLIVAHEVITDGVDRDQLAPMAEHARAATGIERADRGGRCAE